MTPRAAFLSRAGPGLLAQAKAEDPTPRLTQALARAQARWPQVKLAPVDFFASLGERADDLAALDRLAIEDLYLACACLQHTPSAVSAFDTLLRAECARASRKAGGPGADELFSSLRTRLLFEPGALASYRGLGSLGGWLAAAAVRATHDARREEQRRRSREEVAGAPSVPALTPVLVDPELELLRARYRDDFNAAFRDALAGLDEEARGLLRLHVVEGLGLDRIARLRGVGRSTAARWLSRLRADLHAQTRAALRERLSLGDSTLDSLFKALGPDLELSLRSGLTR